MLARWDLYLSVCPVCPACSSKTAMARCIRSSVGSISVDFCTPCKCDRACRYFTPLSRSVLIQLGSQASRAYRPPTQTLKRGITCVWPQCETFTPHMVMQIDAAQWANSGVGYKTLVLYPRQPQLPNEAMRGISEPEASMPTKPLLRASRIHLPAVWQVRGAGATVHPTMNRQ